MRGRFVLSVTLRLSRRRGQDRTSHPGWKPVPSKRMASTNRPVVQLIPPHDTFRHPLHRTQLDQSSEAPRHPRALRLRVAGALGVSSPGACAGDQRPARAAGVLAAAGHQPFLHRAAAARADVDLVRQPRAADHRPRTGHGRPGVRAAKRRHVSRGLLRDPAWSQFQRGRPHHDGRGARGCHRAGLHPDDHHGDGPAARGAVERSGRLGEKPPVHGPGGHGHQRSDLQEPGLQLHARLSLHLGGDGHPHHLQRRPGAGRGNPARRRRTSMRSNAPT